MDRQYFCEKGKMNNAGSTMVEVLVGFIILTLVLSSCVVHMINVSGNMVKKSADVLQAQSVLNREMYKKDADFKLVCEDGASGGGSQTLTFTLRLDQDKTNTDWNHAADVSLRLPAARLYRFDCEEAELSVYELRYAGEAGGPP